MPTKITSTEIEKKMLEILETEGISMSIREIKIELEQKYNILKSPQIIKRHLLLLKKKGKIN